MLFFKRGFLEGKIIFSILFEGFREFKVDFMYDYFFIGLKVFVKGIFC